MYSITHSNCRTASLIQGPILNVFISAVFSEYKAMVLGPLATALTITPTFKPAATALALAAGNLAAKEE